MAVRWSVKLVQAGISVCFWLVSGVATTNYEIVERPYEIMCPSERNHSGFLHGISTLTNANPFIKRLFPSLKYTTDEAHVTNTKPSLFLSKLIDTLNTAEGGSSEKPSRQLKTSVLNQAESQPLNIRSAHLKGDSSAFSTDDIICDNKMHNHDVNIHCTVSKLMRELLRYFAITDGVYINRKRGDKRLQAMNTVTENRKHRLSKLIVPKQSITKNMSSERPIRKNSDKEATLQILFKVNRKLKRRIAGQIKYVNTTQKESENTETVKEHPKKDYPSGNEQDESVDDMQLSKKSESETVMPWTCVIERFWVDLGPNVYPRFVSDARCSNATCYYGYYHCLPNRHEVNVLVRHDGVCEDNGLPPSIRNEFMMSTVEVTNSCICGREW